MPVGFAGPTILKYLIRCWRCLPINDVKFIQGIFILLYLVYHKVSLSNKKE